MTRYRRINNHIESLKINNPRVSSFLEWLNITNTSKNDIEYLRHNYHFDLVHLKVASASVSFQRPMIFRGKDYLCLVLHFPTFKNERIVSTEVDFYIGHGFLISVNNDDLKSLTKFFQLGKKSPDSLLAYSLESSAILLYEILGHLIDGIYPLLDQNSLKINEIEDLIFSDKQKESVEKILLLRRNIVNIRKIIQNHKNILQKLLEMESSLVEKSAIKKYYAGLVEHSKRIWETLDNQKEMVEVLNNTNESLLNGRMTDIIRTLTIFSVIIFPLTLLAAIFAMRTKGTPIIDHPGSFWIIISIMFVISLGMLSLFKHKKWL